MTSIQRVRCDWTGFIGQPGVSTFYAVAASTLVPQLRTFFDAIKLLLPTDVNIQVEGSGDELESTTGALTGSWTTTTPASVQGASANVYSAVSGALVQWKSDTVLSGRRLRGHTFIVPLVAVGYDTSGQVLSTFRTSLNAAAAALVLAAGSNMLLYQRPRVAAPAYTDRKGVVHPAIVARGGGYGPVVTGTSRAIVTELKSRRD